MDTEEIGEIEEKKREGLGFFGWLALGLLLVVGGGLLSGLRLCSVVSGSMEPTIPTWSMCVINTRTDYDDLAVGDVIVYYRAADGARIIHRIIAIYPEGIVTKGDANSVDDGLSVTRNNYYAKSLFHIPHLGGVSQKLSTPEGVCAIAAIAFILIISSLVDMRKGK